MVGWNLNCALPVRVQGARFRFGSIRAFPAYISYGDDGHPIWK